MSQQPAPESLRVLPINDTQALLELMGDNWEPPSDNERFGVPEVDKIAIEWIGFCEHAKRGLAIIDKGTFSGDLISLGSINAFMKSLNGEAVDYPEVITNIESAFALLLSAEALKRTEELDLIRDIEVNDNLQGLIGILVANMEVITHQYITTRRSERQRLFYDD